MRYQVTYPVEGTNALKTDAPRRQPSSGRIIPFPGNPRSARSSELRLVDREALRNWKSPVAGGSAADDAAHGAAGKAAIMAAAASRYAGAKADVGAAAEGNALAAGGAMPGVGTVYVPARHLFYWMTDETSARLHAKHARRLPPIARRFFYYADRVRNAIVNYPFMVQLRYGTPGAYSGRKPSVLQVIAFLVCACVFAYALALLGR